MLGPEKEKDEKAKIAGCKKVAFLSVSRNATLAYFPCNGGRIALPSVCKGVRMVYPLRPRYSLGLAPIFCRKIREKYRGSM